MADFEELSFSYLGLLSNAHHDGTTQQILASFQQQASPFGMPSGRLLQQLLDREPGVFEEGSDAAPVPREGGRGMEEVAGGPRGEAAAGCGQAAG